MPLQMRMRPTSGELFRHAIDRFRQCMAFSMFIEATWCIGEGGIDQCSKRMGSTIDGP